MACVPSFIVGLVLILISIFIENRVGAEWVMALRVIAVLVFGRQLYDFFILLSRSDNKFMFLSKIQILVSAIDLMLIVILVIRFGFYGFLWASALGYMWIIGYIFYRVRHRYNLKFYFNRKLLKNLLKIGLLITAVGVIISLRATVDRLMIIRFLGVTELGYFGISYILIRFIFLIPSAVTQIIYPRLTEKYGSSNKDTNALKSYIEVSTFVLSYSMPLLIGVTFLLLPFGIHLLLPQYIPGIAAAQITILGLFFVSSGAIAGSFLTTTNRLYLYLFFSSVAVIVNFVLDYVFLKAGFGINGVALGGILITSFIYTSSILGYVIFHYLRSVSKTLYFIGKMYFPFFYSALLLGALAYFGLHIVNQMIIYVIACLPLFWKLEKDTKAVSLMFGVIKNGIKNK